MPRNRNKRGKLNVFLFGILCLLLVGVIAIIVFVVPSSSEEGEPPAPPPPPPPVSDGECSWCDELLDRMNPSASGGGVAKRNVECTPLSQTDFVWGTFIADTPNTCYQLTEDIVFHPNEVGDFRPTKSPYANDPTFVLDFLAAILVRAPGVTIDLGGFEIRQSVTHALEQRFFAAIELTTPFIEGQGPADFVDNTPTPASNFVLRNGRVGLSSHHGVHGNGAWSVLIEDVTFSDYEVAAIHLNGMHDVVIRRVIAAGSRITVPVLGTYSSARFIMPFVRKALIQAVGLGHASADLLTSKAAHLITLMMDVKNDVVATGRVNKNTHPEAYALFANPTEFPDGSASYGILLHAHGVAVNGFECDRSDDRHDNMHHILIEDCEIHKTAVDVVEVPVLQEVATGKLQRGPAGDVLRIAELWSEPHGAYKHTALSDVKAALQMLVTDLGNPVGFGTLAVHPGVLQWMGGDAGHLTTLVSNGDFRYMRNGDTMFHVNKGGMALRIGGGHHIAIRRTVVDGVLNVGKPAIMDPLPGETVDSAYWSSGEDGGHPGADPQHGYGGADAVGIGIAGASNVFLDTVTVRNVNAHAGWSTGIYIFNDASTVTLHDVSIFDVSAHTNTSIHVNGPKHPRAVGVAVTTDAREPTYTGSFDIQGVHTGRVGTACNTLKENTGIEKCSPSETNFYAM